MDLDILLTELPILKSTGGHDICTTELLRVDPGNLTEEMLKHATYQGFIGFQHAEAKLMVARATRLMKQLRASKSFYYRENLENLYGVRPTVDTVEAAVERDPEIVKIYENLSLLEHRENQLYVLREAFLARKDALVHLSANERIERKLRPVE